jgi:hypothetical protein
MGFKWGFHGSLIYFNGISLGFISWDLWKKTSTIGWSFLWMIFPNQQKMDSRMEIIGRYPKAFIDNKNTPMVWWFLCGFNLLVLKHGFNG